MDGIICAREQENASKTQMDKNECLAICITAIVSHTHAHTLTLTNKLFSKTFWIQ